MTRVFNFILFDIFQKYIFHLQDNDGFIINIAVDLILENKPEIELTKTDLTKLFEFATTFFF